MPIIYLPALAAGVAPVRMVKTGGSQGLSGSMAILTNMAADAGYPATVVVSNQIIHPGGPVTISAAMSFTGGFGGSTHTARIHVAGAAVGTAGTSTAASGTITVPDVTTTLAALAAVDIRGQVQFQGSATSTTTWLLIQPA